MLQGSDFLPASWRGEGTRITRFAPSPTGFLHIGHAYSAQFAYEAARAVHGQFLLRIEDIDRQRCRPEFEQATREDLLWLGLRWDRPVRRQSEHWGDYERALAKLRQKGVLYPCFCSRRQIQAEVEEADRAPHGPSGEPVYPGTCRHLTPAERAARMAREPFAWRLDVAKALALTGRLTWIDCRAGEITADPLSLGDVVLARKDTPTSYHLSVTVDDAIQGVTLVTRGEDLFHATHIHRLLQALLDLPTPRWYHHNLLADRNGQRMSKRNRAMTLRHRRDLGDQPADIWRAIGLTGHVAAEPALAV
jgi:glutamyl-Q tRNA(Asp) synthetase